MPQIVDLAVAGSNPVGHPILHKRACIRDGAGLGNWLLKAERGAFIRWNRTYYRNLSVFAGDVSGAGNHPARSPMLHTPLMSLTNAISAIAVVGSIVIAGETEDDLERRARNGRRRRLDDQHRRRLHDYLPHAGDVQETRTQEILMEHLIQLCTWRPRRVSYSP